MWVGTKCGEDARDIRALQGVCNLYAEESETEVPQFQEALIWFWFHCYLVFCFFLALGALSHDEPCLYDALLDAVARREPLHLVHEYGGSLFAHLCSALLHGGELRVAGDGTLAVGEAAHRDIVGHAEAVVLCRVHYADSCVVVHAEERVGAVGAAEHAGRDAFGILALVADEHQRLVGLHTRLQQCVVIAVVAVLSECRLALHAVEGDAAAARLDEVCHGSERPLIVVHHHAACVHARTDAVVEHERYAAVDERLEVGVVLRLLSLRHDYAAHLVSLEHLAQLHFALVLLARGGGDDAVATFRRSVLNAVENGGEIIMCELGHDDTKHLHRLLVRVAQRFGDVVRVEVVRMGVLANKVAFLLADTCATVEGTRHSGYGHTEMFGDVLHRGWLQFRHSLDWFLITLAKLSHYFNIERIRGSQNFFVL